jgi:hypothetical protein
MHLMLLDGWTTPAVVSVYLCAPDEQNVFRPGIIQCAAPLVKKG